MVHFILTKIRTGDIILAENKDDKDIWTKHLPNLTGITPDGSPEPLDKWISSDKRLRLVFSFESNNPIDFIQSIHITHPELFI